MQALTPPPSSTFKRKRPITDSDSDSSHSPSRLKTTNLPSRPLGERLEDDNVAESSPRTAVAGHFENLDIQPQELAVSKLDFGMGKRKNETTGTFAPQVLLPKGQSLNRPVTPPPSSQAGHRPPSLEIPESPPTTKANIATSPATPSTPSTLAPSTPDPRLGNKSPVHPSTPQPPPQSSSTPNSPLSLWWTDTEITGHAPTDPTDDGYGINGVGFVPTPAMANARAEKRRRQVREWKEREAREARARRGVRRQRNRGELGDEGVKMRLGEGLGDAIGEVGGGRVEKEKNEARKAVRFSDVMEVEV